MGDGIDNEDPRAAAFAILVDACRAAATGAETVRGRDRPAPLIGAALIEMAERHRVSTQVLRILARYPGIEPAWATRLLDMAHQRRSSALKLSAATGALSRALTDAGVRHLVLKGPALSQRLYGDLAARDCKDIDVIVDPAARARAETAVAELGFSRADGSLSPPADAWRQAIGPKDVSFRSRDRSIELELHDRPFDNAWLMPRSFDLYWADRETLPVAGAALPILSETDEFLYLCGHGASCAWFRLKWLQDIARIVATGSSETFERHAAAARERGVWTMVQSAVILVEDIFDLPAPDSFASRRSRAVERVVRESHRALQASAIPAPSPPLSQLRRLLALQFALRNDWRYRRAVVARALVSQHDLDTVTLPSWASWLYYPLRPLLFALRRARRAR